MQNFVNQLFSKILEVNFSLLIIGFFILFTTLGVKGCANDQLEGKNRQQYMIKCVEKGIAPSECALGWKTSKGM